MTLFSAPNYCGDYDNAGGMMSVNEDLMCSFQVGPEGVRVITILELSFSGPLVEQNTVWSGLGLILEVNLYCVLECIWDSAKWPL